MQPAYALPVTHPEEGRRQVQALGPAVDSLIAVAAAAPTEEQRDPLLHGAGGALSLLYNARLQ